MVYYLLTLLIAIGLGTSLIYLLGIFKATIVIIAVDILAHMVHSKIESISYHKRKKEMINCMYEKNYDNFIWIVNYYISKKSYPYIGKNECLKLKRALDLKKEDDFKDQVEKIEIEYIYINLERVRYNLLSRMKYKKAEVGTFDFFNEIDKGYKKFKEDNIKLLELDKWVVKQVVGADVDTYGIVSNSDLNKLKILIS